MSVRIGWGYDSHRFTKGRRIMLGGVAIPFTKALKGHSDADVLLHAVTDALLGAVSAGDIGTHFPDSDPRWRGVSSLVFVREAARLVRRRHAIVNIDATLLAEAPRVGPYRQRIRAAIARAAGVPVDRVSFKAKTNEGMGFVGRKEGLAAVAVASVESKGKR